MKTWQIKGILITTLLLLVLVLITLPPWSYHKGYDEGKEAGQKEVPANIVEISGIEIVKENGLYRFTVTSGNKTFTTIELHN